ncbi:chromate efflux transporter [Corynebacterium sp. 153RC1]|uniref:chromate efflux transporter n=1 Tax=unclassified Corynebacterium TaxID=2624378 RepID=UPI00211BB655|nr:MULTISPECIES: chromate efflux transporter [unclassified Corynebacterium]MCQ9351831.1 chromate efflux transporter [Corynebacterium sp. 209RC1]MCQ9354988.1 chromate efflux transporter [Corynebacterium sp. 1222RC1]MCQ9356113.1 chromate efflux transporter [Corynebacterium sp. 122RC1]MCQ9359508.1 chromate efflux transporter [Corynebacterium sp. 142RC1]MCQ9360727.1 chromate efflux transporter [Corynebacterium sp. 153RC1]
MAGTLRASIDVLKAFTLLGLTSFGGPTAHLGYFRQEFVAKRRWLSDASYADIVALCQFLPGPASSQVGMAIGWRRSGGLGMLAAFVGFTAPSAVIMAAATSLPFLENATKGLMAAAVAVVVIALIAMAKTLASTVPSALIALATAAALIAAPHAWMQLFCIAAGALISLMLPDAPSTPTSPPPAGRVGWAPVAAIALVALLIASSFFWWGPYLRAGALVFGGGHVVLPMLEADLVLTQLDAPTFLAGYGLAQAMPGPLFTLASYLGAATGGAWGALVATLAIFAPSFLLLAAIMPVWTRLAALAWIQRALRGINAAVVGLLGAALWDPVIAHGITDLTSALIAAAAGIFLWRGAPAWAVVLAAGFVGMVVS